MCVEDVQTNTSFPSITFAAQPSPLSGLLVWAKVVMKAAAAGRWCHLWGWKHSRRVFHLPDSDEAPGYLWDNRPIVGSYLICNQKKKQKLDWKKEKKKKKTDSSTDEGIMTNRPVADPQTEQNVPDCGALTGGLAAAEHCKQKLSGCMLRFCRASNNVACKKEKKSRQFKGVGEPRTHVFYVLTCRLFERTNQGRHRADEKHSTQEWYCAFEYQIK